MAFLLEHRSGARSDARPSVEAREEIRVSVEEILGRGARRAERFLLRPGKRLPRRFRGAHRDRLQALGERVFEARLLPRLDARAVDTVRDAVAAERRVVLVGRPIDLVARPLARHLEADAFVAASPAYRAGRATGRILPGGTPAAPWPGAPRAATFDEGGSCLGRREELSVRRTLAGRHVLLIGASGFIGKAWLAGLLTHLPEIGRITVLLRERRGESAADRLRTMLATSPAFATGRRADAIAGDRLRALAGDIARPGLGLGDDARRELETTVDVIVNCAGLTQFNPDLRKALAVNVDGALNVLELARRCRQAGLVHVSTSFVAKRDARGRVPEALRPLTAPDGRLLDPGAEVDRLRGRLSRLGGAGNGAGSVRRSAIDVGAERAHELGWPNTYTFTKALAEALILERRAELPVAVVRPAIVEASRTDPVPGWNEGVNGTTPITHLLASRLRHLPINPHRVMDVVPVDAVARGLTLVAAALCAGRHPPVTQLGTSETNPLPLGRMFRLTELAHEAARRRAVDRAGIARAAPRTTPVTYERYRRLSVPALLRGVRTVNRAAARLGLGRPLGRAERSLRRTRDLVDLYEPFLMPEGAIFEATNIGRLDAALPPDERRAFGYEVRYFDWYDYWVHVVIPSQRRWTYPVLEGRLPEVEMDSGGRSRTGATQRGVRTGRVEWQRS